MLHCIEDDRPTDKTRILQIEKNDIKGRGISSDLTF